MSDPDPLASALLTVEEARRYVWRNEDDGTRDEVLIEAVNRVSVAISRHCEREFTNTGTATRTFALRAKTENGSVVGWLNLSPYDLRTATTVTLYTDTSGPQALTADEYRLRPVGGALGGTYLDVITIAPTAAEEQPGFGWEAQIAGSWGMSTVPEDVKLACADWTKNLVANPGSFAVSEMAGYSVLPDVEQLTTGHGMPRSVQHRLQRWRRRP